MEYSRDFIGEFLGTFLLVLFGCGVGSLQFSQRLISNRIDLGRRGEPGHLCYQEFILCPP